MKRFSFKNNTSNTILISISVHLKPNLLSVGLVIFKENLAIFFLVEEIEGFTISKCSSS